MHVSKAGLGLLLLVSACATRPEPPRGPPGPQLFVSPFGEPFRAAPDAPYPVSAWFTAADSDRNGALTPAEFTADGDRWFARLDRDGDRILGFSEISLYEQTVAQALGGGHRPDGAGGHRPGSGGPGPGDNRSLADDSGQQGPPGGDPGRGPGGRGGGRGPGGPGGGGASILAMAGLLNVPQPVKSADVNFDQKVTLDEWHATADRWFRLLDADRDGRLVLTELPETALQRRGPGRGPPGGRRRG
jgi:hypothetical protein